MYVKHQITEEPDVSKGDKSGSEAEYGWRHPCLGNYHRDLQCLVAFELKTEIFSPSNLGQINFYLEALDRDFKKSHENPSIGILLCKGKDDMVVEYALSRSLSPALIADYQIKLPNKKLLQEKWLELIELSENKNDEEKK